VSKHAICREERVEVVGRDLDARTAVPRPGPGVRRVRRQSALDHESPLRTAAAGSSPDAAWSIVKAADVEAAPTSDQHASLLRLTVGDLIVYGFHGVGLIAASEGGKGKATIVIEFTSGLRVTLPVTRARERLRALSNESDLARVVQILGADESSIEPQWSKRFRATQEKITAGRVTGLAEVVRDGAHRERRQTIRSGSTQSPAERELYARARRLLAEEVGAARGIDVLAADNWIAEQIEPAIQAGADGAAE
jgi:CarD family transcriptional regulator